MPAAKPLYGILNATFANQRSADESRTMIALLVLVTGLAAANIWFFAQPLFGQRHPPAQDCQTLVLTKSGVSKCLAETTP